MAGITALMVGIIPYRVARAARIAALTTEVWMIVAGILEYAHTKRVGGDWAGVGYLAAAVFILAGGLMLLVSWLGLRYLRRTLDTQPATREQ